LFIPIYDDSLLSHDTEQFPVTFEQRRGDVIIITQSCELENDKSDFVLVCPYYPLVEVENLNEYFKSSDGKEQTRRGNVPGYHMLAESQEPGFEQTIQIVDFRSVQSLPFKFLRAFANSQEKRLRLLSPYREHLAQAFARFFMRVGLPTDIPPFKSRKK